MSEAASSKSKEQQKNNKTSPKKIKSLSVTSRLKSEINYWAPGNGLFHSMKILENSGLKSIGTESFRKLVSKISVNLSRLSFFREIWRFRKFPVPSGITTRHESVLVPLVENYTSTKAARRRRVRTTLVAKRSATVWANSWLPNSIKTLRSDFLENCRLVVSNFL